MGERDWRSSLTDADEDVLASCLRAAAHGPFFPDWEFSTLLGFERSEVAAVADSWPETADDVLRYSVVSAVLNNLLGYPHGVRDPRWSEWVPVDREELEDLFHRIREDSGANDRTRSHLASALRAFAKLDPDGLRERGPIVRDVVKSAERLGVRVPDSVAAHVAVAGFGARAQVFCGYLETGQLKPNELHSSMVTLIEDANGLPKVEPSDVEYEDPAELDSRCQAVERRVGELLDGGFYEVVAESGEVLIADLRDDLFDIYRDLQRGLAVAAVDEVDGIWELRFSFETHWGEHARSAIGALDARSHPGEET